MRTWVGTSGYNYPEWRGSFYPDKLAAARMLPYYAERFTTVEINYTFYRTPNEKILAGWNRETPPGFRLTLKAPKRITHLARLRDCADLLQYFLRTAATLGQNLGAILFQLPSFGPRVTAVLRKYCSRSAQSLSLARCVMRLGALRVSRNPGGVSRFQPARIFSFGVR